MANKNKKEIPSNFFAYKRIRYTPKINSEIQRVVRNYNQKVARVQKFGDSFNYSIPDKVSIKELKNHTYTIGEMRRKLKNLEMYSQRGMENTIRTKNGYNISTYEYLNLKKESRRVKNIISREIKRLEETKPTSFGKIQSRTFAQMGDSYYTNLKDVRERLNKDIEKLNYQEFKEYRGLVQRRGRSHEYQNSLFRENYLTMLTDTAYFSGYDKEKMVLNEDQIKELNRKHHKEELFKALQMEEIVDEETGEKKYAINKIKYLEYSLSKIKSNKKFYKFFRTEKTIENIISNYLLATGQVKGFNPKNAYNDINDLFDNLVENIDEYIKDYL